MTIEKLMYLDSSSCVSCDYISLGNYLFHPNRHLHKKLKSSWWFFEWSLLLFPWYFASTVFCFLLSLLDYLMVYVFYYLQTLILNSWGCFHFCSQWKPYEWESVFPSWKRLARVQETWGWLWREWSECIRKSERTQDRWTDFLMPQSEARP